MDQNRKKKKDPKEPAEKAEKAFVSDFSFHSDPFGSYTGHSKEDGEKPEQDADDL